ncbi:hypothetical protein [Mycoplasmopsis felifaucium]|uniref:Uncharacterized protein n=1 Tax=Mycoplasmopsis felifaucium TaxID=35768 RepID=A0ABZ2RSI6_9BACT
MNKCKILAKVNLVLMFSLIFGVFTFGVTLACLYWNIGEKNRWLLYLPKESLASDIANIKESILGVYYGFIPVLGLLWIAIFIIQIYITVLVSENNQLFLLSVIGLFILLLAMIANIILIVKWNKLDITNEKSL